MKHALSLLLAILLATTLSTQPKQVYTLSADSTKLTGCDSNELIIENHTQSVLGFLYNTGNGRTIFKKALAKVNDTIYLVGGDTLKLFKPIVWFQSGNTFGSRGKIGTRSFNSIDYSNSMQAQPWLATF